MAWVDGVIDLEVVIPSITRGGDVVERLWGNLVYYITGRDCNCGEFDCNSSWYFFTLVKLATTERRKSWYWLCLSSVFPIGKVDTQLVETLHAWSVVIMVEEGLACLGYDQPIIYWGAYEGPWAISSWIGDGDMVYQWCLRGPMLPLLPNSVVMSTKQLVTFMTPNSGCDGQTGEGLG